LGRTLVYLGAIRGSRSLHAHGLGRFYAARASMRYETDEGFVSIIAENDAEAALLKAVFELLAQNTPSTVQLVDNTENPGNRIIDGILVLQVS
jgi:hypothetical protein